MDSEQPENIDRHGIYDYSRFLRIHRVDNELTNELTTTEIKVFENKVSKKISNAQNFSKYVPVDFGLPNKNLNWKLADFLDIDILNKICNVTQADALYDVIDWNNISHDEIPGPIMVHNKDRINWSIFLRNKKPKEINYLIDVKDKLTENQSIFFNPRIKKRYYNTPFILVFPELIDFRWLIKNIKLDEYVLLKFWDKFKPNDISRYQNITYAVAKEKLYQINWLIASKRLLDEQTITLANELVNWQIICRRQKGLSEEFLTKFAKQLHWGNVSRYQQLTPAFILKYRKKLNMYIISEYQNMQIELIKELEPCLDFANLIKNKHYNKQNSIQIASNGKLYFIIEPPPMGKIPNISYFTADDAEL